MELMAPLTQRYPFGMLVLCLAVVAAGNRMPGKEKERRGQGPHGQRVSRIFTGSSGYGGGVRKEDLPRPLIPVSVLSSAQPGVCGPHSSVAALLAVVITGVWIADRSLFLAVDYSLLLTFCAFFVFIGKYGKGAGFLPVPGPDSGGPGNHHLCGRQPDYQQCARCPLLSGFSGDYSALIVGTNLGGLGTLIASMASLISYKHIARMYPMEKGRYLGWFYRC